MYLDSRQLRQCHLIEQVPKPLEERGFAEDLAAILPCWRSAPTWPCFSRRPTVRRLALTYRHRHVDGVAFRPKRQRAPLCSRALRRTSSLSSRLFRFPLSLPFSFFLIGRSLLLLTHSLRTYRPSIGHAHVYSWGPHSRRARGILDTKTFPTHLFCLRLAPVCTQRHRLRLRHTAASLGRHARVPHTYIRLRASSLFVPALLLQDCCHPSLRLCPASLLRRSSMPCALIHTTSHPALYALRGPKSGKNGMEHEIRRLLATRRRRPASCIVVFSHFSGYILSPARTGPSIATICGES